MQVINNKRRFTLLELFIVVAMMGVTGVIIAVALGEGREKGRNMARISQVKEYQKAFELFYSNSETGRYPIFSIVEPNQQTSTNKTGAVVCLGDYSDDRCWNNGSGIAEQALFNAQIVPDYMRILPLGDSKQFGVNGNTWYEGMTYRHENYGKQYRIQYFLEGNNRDCGLLGTDTPGNLPSNIGPDTRCTLLYPYQQ